MGAICNQYVVRLANHAGNAIELGPFRNRALAQSIVNQHPGLVGSVVTLAPAVKHEIYATVLMDLERQAADDAK